MKKKLLLLAGASCLCLGLLTGCLARYIPPPFRDLLLGPEEEESSSVVTSSPAVSPAPMPKPSPPASSAPQSAAEEVPPAIGTEELPALYESLEGQWMDANKETVLNFANYEGYYWVGLGFAYSEYIGEYRVLGAEKQSDTVYTLYFDQYNKFEFGDNGMNTASQTVQDSMTIDLGEAGDNRFTLISSKTNGNEQMSGPLDFDYDYVNSP